jgi:hypothetical protein
LLNSRRYELLLPTNFNDGSLVPQKLLGQTLRELRKTFTPQAFHSTAQRRPEVAEGRTLGNRPMKTGYADGVTQASFGCV